MTPGPGNGRDTNPDIGNAADPCHLGSDCPFEPSMRQLENERRDRREAEGEIVVRVDKLSDRLVAAIALVEQFSATVKTLDESFSKHVKSHRWIELIVMGLAAGAGGALTRYLEGP
jgi:hypothetical protein